LSVVRIGAVLEKTRELHMMSLRNHNTQPKNSGGKMRIFAICLTGLFLVTSIGFAQDPGEPDEVVVGNPDGTPILALPGSVINIPVWVKNDEDVIAFFISAGTEDQFVSGRLDGSLLPIFDDWYDVYFRDVLADQPEPGYSSQGILGLCDIFGPPYDCTPINSNGGYLKIAEFTVQISDDPSNIGLSTQIVGGYSPYNGSTWLSDDQQNMWNPTFTGGTIMIIEDVPTLSEWGMLIMGLLLLVVGTVAVVRRRKAILSRAS
jgi:hypothetical protein